MHPDVQLLHGALKRAPDVLPAPVARLVTDELTRALCGDEWVTARHPYLLELATSVLAVKSHPEWGVRWSNDYERVCDDEASARSVVQLYPDCVLICRDVTRGVWREVERDA